MTQPDRYRRQKLLDWLGEAEQARLQASSVLIARVGGLGGPLTQSLAVAGVGRITFYHEGDLLDEDLHRMILMDPDGVGRPRAPQAEAALRRYGRDIDVRGVDGRITPAEARELMATHDVAIGAAPTYEERLTLNDAALAAGKPFVDAAMYADEAHLVCVRPGRSACLRCLTPEPPPWRADFPVLAAVSAIVGHLAALSVIRILAGRGTVPWGTLVHVDTDRFAITRIPIERRPDCPACAAVPAPARAAFDDGQDCAGRVIH